jgi:parvulin-like peptidyl-prolyl isomerase
MRARRSPPRFLNRSVHAMLSRRTFPLLCLLAALAAAPSPAARAAQADPVAVVNGQAIARADFARSLLSSLGSSAMEAYVERVLIAQEARRQGVTVTDQELQARRELEVSLRMQAAQQGARLGPEEFRIAAAGRGMSLEQVREEMAQSISMDALRSKLLAEKLLEPYVDLSDKALRAYYERTRGRRFAAAHIAVADERQARRLMEVLRDRLDLWPDAVTAYSLDRASKPYKGRIGPVPADSVLGRVLDEMSPGTLNVWQEGQVWHVLYLIKEIPASGEDVDQSRDRLRAELLAAQSHSRLYDLLADLWQEASVVVNMSPDPAARRLLGEDVAAFVNGEPIRADDLSEALVQEFGPATLPATIERTLIFQEAARRGLSVTPQELDSRLKAIGERLFADQASQRGLSAQDLQQLLRDSAGSPQQVQERLVRDLVSVDDVRATILAEKMVADDVKVTDQEVQDAYREYGGERYIVRDMATETRAQAELVLDRLDQGASFELLARTESAEPGVWLEGVGLQVVTAGQPWYERVKGLEAGQTSGIFQQDGKYHIIKVVEHDPPSDRPPIDTVREKLQREVFLRKAMDRIRALLLKLRAEGSITVNLV